ncbi:thioredoxin-dependent thiol peroxidase [Sporanaerobacter acetigenes]|uniref:thioredoxin-dependent peroxiredoxin n=1 Tax=Sporanaerobacter acetigenes DSM 13106 TaxID=1123281 RepID=A0A1M5WG81_9FIRM|nr:thioredoxin-dependent thiol peroxidase [Sporanaerobacter acetigenes]SHH86492.1 peroxiredoxin Q/BCP [Sporanaerobacter acetigenes DSM 13106]
MSEYDFTLKETDGKNISLSDFKGKNIVLYFYPKDNTSGCTAEAREFRDLYDEFEKLDTVILGISRDSLKSHAKFRGKENLPFLLLSDEDKKVHELFNVMKLKKMYGKEYMGVERSTFIFNKGGELVKKFRNVKAKGHAEKVLEYIKEELK